MTYKYIAYSADKKLVEGKIDVASENLAEDCPLSCRIREYHQS